MRISTLRYFWSLAWSNLRRHLSPTAASVVVISLIVLGAFLSVIRNAQSVTSDLIMSFQVVAYMELGASDEDVDEATASIRAVPGVTGIEVRTKESELERLVNRFPAYEKVLASLNRNPLVDAIVVDIENPSRAAEVAAVVSRIHPVEEVVYGTEAAERLAACADGLRTLSVAGTAVMIVAVSLVIGSVIGLTVEYRAPEIEVASIVGATGWFIRWPFVLEALLLTVLLWAASAAAVACLYVPAVSHFQRVIPFASFANSSHDVAAVCLQLLVISLASSLTATFIALERTMMSMRKG